MLIKTIYERIMKSSQLSQVRNDLFSNCQRNLRNVFITYKGVSHFFTEN